MSRYHGSKNLWKLTKGSLGNNDGDGNENGKKSNKTIIISKTTTLCKCITPLWTFVSHRCTTAT